MLTTLISVLIGAAVGVASYLAWGVVWAVICGAVCMLAAQAAIGLFLRRKVSALQSELQNLLAEGQNKIQRKLTIMQQRGSTDMKSARNLLEREQNILLNSALHFCDRFNVYSLWSPMLSRQINTMRFAFLYQMKDFKEADALSRRCLFMDPQSISMRLARLYRNNDPSLDKFFKSKSRRLKGESCVLPYCTYAWIKLHSDAPQEALNVLIEAKGKTDNPVVTENWERLANEKYKQFTLSGLGDAWYSLYLEEPKMPKGRRQYA